MPHPRWEEFLSRLGEVIDVRAAVAVLDWDQEVNLPPKALPGRGQQLATISALVHRLFTAPEFGGLLAELGDASGLTLDEARLVSETAYDYDRATRMPEAFVQEFAAARSSAYAAWVDARATSGFGVFRPHLERIVSLLRRKADYLGYTASPYDALLGEYERGATAAGVQAVFDVVGPRQSALVERVIASPHQPDTHWLDNDWDEEAQWALTLRVLADMGYDLEAGRQDRSVHPFTTNFDLYDVRVTTRIRSNDLFSGLMGSMHEGGHALYEQGFREEDRRTTLAEGISLGIHESQSRLWENVIGRSLPFWRRYTPVLREYFPAQAHGLAPEQVHAAVNRVAPSLIRVEADECTYNLHIILRFELEVGLIEGTLAPADIPEAWNAGMKRYLGIDVPDDARGCLQDIHWAHGSIGYFPTYALGNLYAAQLLEVLLRDLPDLWGQVERGEFGPLLAWLRAKVHRVGRRLTAAELIRSVTGRDLSPEPYLAYLTAKYGTLYRL